MTQPDQSRAPEATHPPLPLEQVVYADGTINREVSKVGTSVDLNDGTFKILQVAQTVGITGVDYDGVKNTLVVMDGEQAVWFKGEGKQTRHTAYDLETAQLTSLLAGPLTIGGRSSRLGGIRVDRISMWHKAASGKTPTTDRNNPLRIARDINAERFGIQ